MRPHDDVRDPIRSALRRPKPGPDLTGPVMRRLGLGDMTPRRRRRRRVARATARLALFSLVVFVAVLAAATLGRAPGPAGPTLPAALRHDSRQHADSFDRAYETLRDLGLPDPKLVGHEP